MNTLRRNLLGSAEGFQPEADRRRGSRESNRIRVSREPVLLRIV